MITNVTAIVLAGGKSSRMGKNKALMNIGSEMIMQKLIYKLDHIFSKIIISTNSPDKFSKFNKLVYQDVYPHLGPISGVHSGLMNSATEKNLILPCDMPVLSNEIIEYLANQKLFGDALFFEINRKIQMPFGLYNKRVYTIAEELIKNSDLSKLKTGKIKLRMKDLFAKIDYSTIETMNLNFYTDNQFLNMNTPEDYKKISEIITSTNYK